MESIKTSTIVQPESTQQEGKHHCTAVLLFDWFKFDQTSKADSTKAKQLNPNNNYKQEVSRTAIFPLKLESSAYKI